MASPRPGQAPGREPAPRARAPTTAGAAMRLGEGACGAWSVLLGLDVGGRLGTANAGCQRGNARRDGPCSIRRREEIERDEGWSIFWESSCNHAGAAH